jgi:glycine/serine hydroxymethyltransferase
MSSWVTKAGSAPLQEADPEIFALVGREKERQVDGIELIASEVLFDSSEFSRRGFS